MENWIIQIISSWGVLAVFLLMMLENVFPLISSEVVLLFAGTLCIQAGISPAAMIISATLGSAIGCLLLYWIGRYFDAEWLEKHLHIKKEKLEKTEQIFQKYDTAAVFFARFLPVVRVLISFPAGMAKMPVFKFESLSIAGCLIWDIILVYLGVFLKDCWKVWMPVIEKYGFLLLGIVILACAAYFVLKKKKHQQVNS